MNSTGSAASGVAQTTNKMARSKLLNQVRIVLRAFHYSQSTKSAYLNWIRRFILFHNKCHPAKMAETEVNQFLTHLAINEKVSASTQNQALSALLFLIVMFWTVSWDNWEPSFAPGNQSGCRWC